MTNRLSNSQSIYLQQHAHNPVDWYPWGLEALDKAKVENKPILVSIGYSSCHWCHVMEKESFEDEPVAQLMNEHFVCIKIDREERPDLDNIYMEAVQVMGLRGGWPLNVFLMPDQKPFYGGTYFPKKDWIKILNGISTAFKNQYDQLNQSAQGFGKSLNRDITEKYGLSFQEISFEKEEVKKMGHKILEEFDDTWGGLNRAPKFPMPCIWAFLLDFGILDENKDVMNKVLFTLKKMGQGGIYDQLGGGFARYSVDSEWFAPHFEKMLYDNGQLLVLFSKAYARSKDEFFQEKIEETIDWLEREMMHPEGAFFAALDADSEGEEGKFYVWTYQELNAHLGGDMAWFSELYQIKESGNWESGYNILFQVNSYEEMAEKHGFSLEDFKLNLKRHKKKLLQIRSKRENPGLDDKIISGWNGWVSSGLCQAYLALKNPRYMDLALKNSTFIWEKMVINGALFRNHKNEISYTPAFLEDYAAVIQAFLDTYQIVYDTSWLYRAKSLSERVLDRFLDHSDGLFYQNDPQGEKLIANKKEIFDNVIPAGNSVMARNFHRLGLYFYDPLYLETADKMLKLVHPLIAKEPEFMANWANFYLEKVVPTAEIAIMGKGSHANAEKFLEDYHPNIVLAATEFDDQLPILENKNSDDNLIFVCFDKVCQKPVDQIEDALDQLPLLNDTIR
ncbi:MAG: thioredoxin domain-containing protein [Cyclobacteriaceae bacterium]